MMISLIILFSYLIGVFITRYCDIRLNYIWHNIHYKGYIMPLKWFCSWLGLVVVLIDYLEYKIDMQKLNSKRNFINWFFVDRDYKTNEEIKEKNEFEHEFNKK